MLSPFKRAVYTETGVVLDLLHHNITPHHGGGLVRSKL